MVGAITWNLWTYINAEGTECQVFSLQLQVVKSTLFLRSNHSFFFFFPQVATYGVRETCQIPQFPFWPSKAGLLQRLLFDSFLIALAADDFLLDQIS